MIDVWACRHRTSIATMGVDWQRAATGVGLTTLVIGAALVAAPNGAARLLRLGEHPGGMRAVGLADLALVPGLVRGKPQWPWMAGRGALNLLIAAYIRWLAQREGSTSARIATLLWWGSPWPMGRSPGGSGRRRTGATAEAGARVRSVEPGS
jgi:hypothetical protein